MARATEQKYRAFISYSHNPDLSLAAAVQSSLDRFAKPWYQLRGMRVFRDKTGLSANPALWHLIEEALSESEYFLFLACPESAKSPWVQKEVEWWLKNRSADKMLIATTGGDIFWAGQDFDWAKTTALPGCFKGVFAAEPLYADFRAAKANGKYNDSAADYHGALLDLAATLLGRPKDELDSDDIRLHRRAEETAWLAGIFILVLAILAGAGLYAAHQREKIAASRALASAASAQTEDRSLALLLALESHQLADTVESRRALLAALQRVPHIEKFMWGHTDSLTQAIFSPDGNRILSAAWDNRIVMWDAKTGVMIGDPIHAPEDLVGIAFNHDGSQFASTGNETVAVWDTNSRRLVGEPFRYRKEEFVYVAFSPDGKLLAASTAAYGNHPSQIFLWDLATRQQIGQPMEGANFAFSPDNSLLAICQFGDLQFYDLHAHRSIGQPLAGHEKNISAIAFSQDGTLAATGAEDKTVVLWDVKKRRLLGKLGSQSEIVRALLFNARGDVLFSGSADGAIMRWKLRDIRDIELWGNEALKAVDTPVKSLGAAISSIFLNADGSVKALALERTRTITLNVSDNPALGRRIQAVEAKSSNVAFSPDGRWMASSGDFGTITEWDVSTGEVHGEPLTGHEKQVTALAYCGDGKELVSGAMDGTVIFWDTATHHAQAGPLKVHRSPVWSMACSPDGKMAASGADAQLIFWDTATFKPLGSPATSQKDRIWTLAFSPNGAFLAAAGNSHNVAIWKTGNPPQPEKMLTAPLSDEQKEVTPAGVSFNADGTQLAMSAPQNTVTLWNFKSGKLIEPMMYGHTQSVTSVAFSRDGKMLASGSDDGDIRLWDVGTHQLLGTLNGGQSSVHSVVFSARDGVMASVGEEDSIILWEADFEKWAVRACQIANRNLTATEWASYFGKQPYRKTCSSL